MNKARLYVVLGQKECHVNSVLVLGHIGATQESPACAALSAASQMFLIGLEQASGQKWDLLVQKKGFLLAQKNGQDFDFFLDCVQKKGQANRAEKKEDLSAAVGSLALADIEKHFANYFISQMHQTSWHIWQSSSFGSQNAKQDKKNDDSMVKENWDIRNSPKNCMQRSIKNSDNKKLDWDGPKENQTWSEQIIQALQRKNIAHCDIALAGSYAWVLEPLLKNHGHYDIYTNF